jgi:nucleotide-binding universal stress UspA family protein
MLIAHTTSATAADDSAFAHAVAFCARGGARLAIVHAGDTDPPALPRPESLLARWGTDSPIESEVRVLPQTTETAEVLLEALAELDPALVVCATQARKGIGRMLEGSVAEAIARSVGCPTLIVPPSARPFVDAATGQVDLNTIAIPARGTPEADRALSATRDLCSLLGVDPTRIVIVHSDDGSPAPEVRGHLAKATSFISVPPPIDRSLLDTVEELRASLIVMPSQGRDSLTDLLLGSRTERTLRDSPCPLLWVPMNE